MGRVRADAWPLALLCDAVEGCSPSLPLPLTQLLEARLTPLARSLNARLAVHFARDSNARPFCSCVPPPDSVPAPLPVDRMEYGPGSSAAAASHEGLAFSLSRLLADKMALRGFVPGLHDAPPAAARASHGEESGPAWLIQRCPATTMARLDGEGGCFWCAHGSDRFLPCPRTDRRREGRPRSGKLDRGASLCHGNEENDRRAICVEDLRDDAQRDEAILQRLVKEGYDAEGWPVAKEGEAGERSKRRRATCGLGSFSPASLPSQVALLGTHNTTDTSLVLTEYREGFEPASQACPAGYARVGDPEGGPFICQHTASPYSVRDSLLLCVRSEPLTFPATQCGREQRDCYSRPGILHAECSDEGLCETSACSPSCVSSRKKGAEAPSETARSLGRSELCARSDVPGGLALPL